MDRRERLIAVFEDTQTYYTENRRLAEADSAEEGQNGKRIVYQGNVPGCLPHG